MATALVGTPLTNWAGNVTFRAERLHRPTTVEQLQQTVAGARRIRALGTGHSFNRIADTTADLVSVAGLPREVEPDSARGCVRVSAGTRYGELVGPLQDAGLALHNLGSLPHISIGGACATGTHGSGVGNGTLASAVSALEMVTADGSLVRLTRDGDPGSFDGCVVALGALGVVTMLELDVQPSYDVRQYVYDGLPLEALRAGFDEVMSAGYSVNVFSDWSSARESQVWRRLRIGPGEMGDAPQEWLGARLADGPRHPILGLPGLICTEQLGVLGPWHERLPYFRLDFTPSSGQELQSEWFVRREDAVAALDALEDLRDRIAALLHVAEIRSIAADRLWLSPSAGRDTVALHFTWLPSEPAVLELVAAIEERLEAFDARPHWGKLSMMAPSLVRQRYERFSQFEGLLRTYDPAGKLRNEMLEGLFPPPSPALSGVSAFGLPTLGGAIPRKCRWAGW